MKASKNTFLYDGLVAAIEELESVRGRRVIILITDGKDSGEGNYGYENVIDQAMGNSTPIYALAFGNIVNKDELTKMATITGGVAQVNPDSEDLLSGFNQIMDILRKQYVLRFESNLPANNQEHTLALSVDYLDETYTSEKSFTIDTAPRIAVQFNSPVAGEPLSGVQEILLSIDSKYDIEEVIISANDEVLATLIKEPYSVEWELHSIHNGDYTVKVDVRDEKNLIYTEEIIVTVNQVGSSKGGGSEENMGINIYLILALFVILLIVVIAFGIRKRRKSVTPLPVEGSEGFAVLIELAGRNTDKTWQLDAPEIRLGRKSDINDIPLQGGKASREMAIIQTRENQHIIYSIKSDNPILVNDIPIQRETILRAGDIIVMGESMFRYEIKN